MSEGIKLSHDYISRRIVNYLIHKEMGNWHEEKAECLNTHEQGVDIRLVGGKRNSEYFLVEVKAKSYSENKKSADSSNKEGWLNALGQIVTRMDVRRFTKSRTDGHITSINRAYKYGLGLCWEGAQVALRRIPKEAATTLNLHIFSVDDEGFVVQFTPKDFGKEHPEEDFHQK